LVKLPLSGAAVNSLRRSIKLQLSPDGTLQGDVRETRRGARADEFRAAWRESSEADRKKSVQDLFSGIKTTVELGEISAANLDGTGDPGSAFSFRLPRFASWAGGLVVLAAAWTSRSADVLEGAPRTHPLTFAAPSHRLEEVEISLPESLAVDEMPEPLSLDVGFAAYSSKAEAAGNVLRFRRVLEIREVLIMTGDLPEIKAFFRKIAAAEKSASVLTRK
jgi:hypothetical protein